MQQTAKVSDHYVTIKKSDAAKQILYSEVYAPYTLDTYGDMMLPEDIEKMAHDYIQRKDLEQTIDIQHNNVPTAAYPIESFIARKGDPDFTEGAWVVGLKIDDNLIWSKIESGEIAGLSMEVRCKQYPVIVEVEVTGSSIGTTAEYADHEHYFYVEQDDEGRVLKGRTDNVMGHSHEIKAGTATEMTLGHKHRFSLY